MTASPDTETVRLRLTVAVEYDAKPEDYYAPSESRPADLAAAMAAIDQEEMEKAPEFLLSLLETEDIEFTVEPVIDEQARDVAYYVQARQELRDRLEKAQAELDSTADRAVDPYEHQRLLGKAQGVALALSYLDEQIRQEKQS